MAPSVTYQMNVAIAILFLAVLTPLLYWLAIATVFFVMGYVR